MQEVRGNHAHGAHAVILVPLSSATVATATAIAILWAEMVLTSPCSVLWWILSRDSRLVCCND
jgi:hypothetical protein